MIELSKTTHKIYDFQQLKEMTGKSIFFNDIDETGQITINDIFIYNCDKLSIRGQRGTAILIDFFNKKGENIATLPVYDTYKLNVSNFSIPTFDTIKK